MHQAGEQTQYGAESGKQDNMKPMGQCIDERTALSREMGTTLASGPVKSPGRGMGA